MTLDLKLLKNPIRTDLRPQFGVKKVDSTVNTPPKAEQIADDVGDTVLRPWYSIHIAGTPASLCVDNKALTILVCPQKD